MAPELLTALLHMHLWFIPGHPPAHVPVWDTLVRTGEVFIEAKMLTVVAGVVTFSVTGVMNTCHHSSCTSGTGRPNFTALFVCCRRHTALQISLTVAGYCSVSTHAGTPPGDALVTALTVGAIALFWQVSLSWSEVSLHVAISRPSNTTRTRSSILPCHVYIKLCGPCLSTALSTQSISWSFSRHFMRISDLMKL